MYRHTIYSYLTYLYRFYFIECTLGQRILNAIFKIPRNVENKAEWVRTDVFLFKLSISMLFRYIARTLFRNNNNQNRQSPHIHKHHLWLDNFMNCLANALMKCVCSRYNFDKFNNLLKLVNICCNNLHYNNARMTSFTLNAFIFINIHVGMIKKLNLNVSSNQQIIVFYLDRFIKR